jgi:hypothetical protein
MLLCSICLEIAFVSCKFETPSMTVQTYFSIRVYQVGSHTLHVPQYHSKVESASGQYIDCTWLVKMASIPLGQCL